ncbi:signal transduction histidine kinase [Pelotomaculum thermopropionicum SI]|uniref:Circadian input-output histidine kinase CikA n=1 Tax=Pelotomaculum thermopropionicum (strain DSM 13744 / JCM 10971 / SI) TaxID=370438 RepID=A5CZK4_PELTS|nr:signal transduction histidine kinase [Pelotomaculum thermopropionicum SI]
MTGLGKKIILAALCAAGLFLVFLYFHYRSAEEGARPPVAVDGVLDLTGWDFQRQGVVPLNGWWEFYWEQLLTPGDLANEPQKTGYIEVPGLWNGYTVNEGGAARRLSGDGYATYRLLVKTAGQNELLALKILDFATSYRLWVNGKLLAFNGRVGKNEAEASPRAFPLLINFTSDRPEIELVLQIANFTHSKGGIWTGISLGTAGQIQTLRERRIAGGLFLAGALVIMAVYHLGLFMLRRKDRSTLFCALLCLLVAVRSSTTGEIIILDLFPGTGWHLLYVLQYLAFYLAVPVFGQFIHLLYPGETSRKLTRFCWGLAALFSLTVIAAPVKVYSKFILWYELYTIFFLLYIALVALVRAALKKREGAGYFILGAVFLALAAINDTLVANDVLDGPFVIDFALFIFLFFQALVLSMRFSRAFATVEKLSGELEAYSRTLEQKVRERTSDLERAKREADTANRAKSDFLALMSHEIRTPMHGLIGTAELLMETPLNEEQREYAAVINESSEMLLAIIDDILDFSRIEEGKLALEEAGFDPRQVEKRVAGLFAPKAGLKGLLFTSAVDAAVPRVLRGDPLRLGQVLLNLVGNAVKFTERGEVSLRVFVEKREGDIAKIRFEVRDTGPGIPEGVRSSLFDPFTQADASTTRRFGGTGLGLSICRRLVELMNGEIGFASEEGRGATFWFTIPFKVGDAVEIPAKNDAAVFGRLPGWAQNPGPILVAEDSPVNRKLIVAQLKKLGLEAELAEDGREAVRAASRTAYALILMDCQMPSMDGYDAARAIRRLEERLGRHTPIVATTAGATRGEREKCLAAGMDDYLGKPVRLADLHRTLARWLPAPGVPPAPGVGDAAAAGESGGMVAAQTSPGYGEFGELLRVTGGDAGLAAEIIETFLQDMPAKLARLNNALARADAAGVRLQAHGMKSSGTIVGAARFAALCREVEDLAGAGDLAGAEALFAQVEDEYRLVGEKLRVFLGEYGQPDST